ncbi:hypothetical protein B0H10DRAFT_2049688 [Mycena sp. CBHHK59/15]|nr:hypothetical protein B0H10DRAFT_2049688 [Mycena sp. CBHHK59/15]
MTTLCTRCRSQLPQIQDTLGKPNNRSQLRSRLAELDTLIDTLTAERRRLQAASDLIVYPVLSLPTEITSKIFQYTLLSIPRPSPPEAPLLLTQICREWRAIAVNDHHLWQSILFEDIGSLELLNLWLSRSGNLPLSYSLLSSDPAQAESLLEASILHAHRWQDVTLTLPLPTFAKLEINQINLPVLRKISLAIRSATYTGVVTFGNTITIQNAPLLLEAHVTTIPHVQFDLPWPQLTTLTLRHNVEFSDCLSLLEHCPELVNLEISITDPGVPAIPPAPLTHHSMQCLTLNSMTLLEYLSLPRLQQLTVSQDIEFRHAAALESFMRRSACILRVLSLLISYIAPDALRACLRAVPDSVVDLELAWRVLDERSAIFNILTTDILPDLATLRLSGRYLSPAEFGTLLDVLRARHAGGVLRSFTLRLDVFLSVPNVRVRPGISTIERFRTLAAEGLKIKMILVLSGSENISVVTLLESSTG